MASWLVTPRRLSSRWRTTLNSVAWRRVKRSNKVALAEYITAHCRLHIDPDAMLDVQVKRIHEYKRQLLNLLHVLALYRRLKEDHTLDIVPRTVLFAGKAAPAYSTSST